MYKLGVDVGATKINIGILNGNNEVAAKRKVMVSRLSEKGITDGIIRSIDGLLAETGVSKEEIASCGVGVPGTVSEDGRRAVKVPNLSLENAELSAALEAATGIPVRLIQDSRAAAYGEYLAGGGQGKKTVVCVTLGSGIGTGIVIDGQVYNGALGGAGEMGHLPAVEGGRPCGCGKSGCMEKYAAGIGLDITAREALGKEDATAADLFRAAEDGDEKAESAIGEAVAMLGRAMVAVVNLLSPDCLLFSGGLAAQEKLYTRPLAEYILSHCYHTDGKDLEIKPAGLGEDAPMIGAALWAYNAVEKNVSANYGGKPEGSAIVRRPGKYAVSASVMCANPLNYGEALRQMESAGVQYLHCDIMDGHFVPNIMLAPEFINSLRKATDIPFDIHIMADDPEFIIGKLDLKSGDYVSVHFESTCLIQRVLSLIKDRGARPAVALCPATPVESVREIMPDVDMVLLMTVNPGFAGQNIVPQSFGKIKRMREFLDSLGYDNIPIQVDGNCSFENIPKMAEAGAAIFVGGSSSVFDKNMSIGQAVDKIFESLR